MDEEKVKELEQLKNDCDEYLNGWKRAKADLINYQKEEARRLEEVVKYANAGMIKELIGVLDSFDLAISVIEKDGSTSSPQIKGIYMIKSQLEDALKRAGVDKIAVAAVNMFDANFQESVAEAEADQPVGSILEVIEQGYMLHGRVIRPARVKISKGSPSTSLGK